MTETKLDPSSPVFMSGAMIPKDTLAVAKIWDVVAPPPTNTIKGAIMPGMVSRGLNRRRRVSVEIHRVFTAKGDTKESEDAKPPPKSKRDVKEQPQPQPESAPSPGPGKFVRQATKALLTRDNVPDNDDYYEECVVRVLSPASSAAKKSMRTPKKHAPHSRDSASASGDDLSLGMSTYLDEEGSTVPGAFTDSDNLANLPDYEGWNAKYKLPIRAISIKRVNNRHVVIEAQYGALKQTRDFIFDSSEEATQFAQMIDAQKEAEEKRSAVKIKHATGGLKLTPGEEVCILVEIVSAADLPIADLTSSDPFVTCYLNGKEVHRTKHVSKNLDPIWTLKTNSLFLLTCSSRELFMSDGLICEVNDFDKLGENEKLGAIIVSPKTLYDGKGERMTYMLQKAAHGQTKDYGKGSLSIRCRHATINDKNFMREFLESNRKESAMGDIVQQATKTKGGKGAIKSVIGKNQKIERLPDGTTITKYRARPTFDPKRKDETEWMTKEEVERDVLKESTEWLDTGSGDAGRLYVEILGCDELPNLDAGGFLGNLTDSFVCCVYEDTSARTDVIDDCLNPRWLSWSRRAFIFHIAHSSSQLFLGVFDFDGGLDNHDLIGRVAVDVSNFRPNTTYVLTYGIYPTANMTQRESKGNITIRLRMEIDDYRKLLFSCVVPPNIMYVNCKKRKDFAVIESSCKGKVDMGTYSMSVITSYIDELTSYQNMALYLKDAGIALLFWRPQVEIHIGGMIYRLPAHSAIAFLMSIVLVERPQLIPSFFFAWISWLLLATMYFRRHNPNPWRRCKSFPEILEGLVTGRTSVQHSITPFENAIEAELHEDVLRQRIEDANRAASDAAKEAQDEQEEFGRENQDIGDANNDISTKKGLGISIDPFRQILEPVQEYLGLVIRMIRFARNVIVWEECYIAFWLCLGSMVLSLVCLLVPWAFLMRWTSRFFVWTVFGPWMRLVDIHYYSKIENMTPEEIEETKQKAKMARREAFEAAALQARIEREDAKKLKAMKTYLFGKFIVKVPIIKESRWADVPRKVSRAEPFKPKSLALAELAMKEAGYHRLRIPGQQLEGVMIPTIESKAFTDAPVGQATREHAKKESDTGAYVKIGSMVAGAAVITWAAVPFVASMAQKMIG